MMEALLRWDTAAMHWINHGWSHPVLDFIFPVLRNKYFWIPLYVLCISWIIYNHKVRHVLMILLFLGLSIFAADTISSQLIKYEVQRPRPCQVMNMDPPVIERVVCGSGYSFTSSHAANHFCIAAFFISIFGVLMDRWKYVWWIWAAIISIAQVYVGLHYPLDIIGGALLGIIVGISMGRFCFHKLISMAQKDTTSEKQL
jgi:membrane-associated phospholipid phosphatase